MEKIKSIKCDECGHEISKSDALEYEYCTECEECLDIPDEWYEELN
jgi:hypothetical protein|tara:strand:- start:822 stop:959 length:138 start_codon:yes stop_codon:yes gene_type:complete